MDYIYSTHVAVPESTIAKICDDLIRNTLHECLGLDIELTDKQLYLISEKMHAVAASMVKVNRVSVDGWTLDDDQVNEITQSLHNGHKIAAIKAFRAATGAGLKESKYFIDSFCTGPRKQACQLSGVTFRATFGK